jgi:RNA polymerase sigma-70 factor, ECF subfamily
MQVRTPSAASRNPPTDGVDSRLMVAIQRGDRLALEGLYRGYYPRLATFLARFATSRENIEEIISDTFMVIWTQASDCRHESEVSTWVIGIAYRTAMRHLTRQRNASSVRWVNDSLQGTDWAKDRFSCALARLPIQQRVTLSLAYQMGCSIEEIASVTGSPIGTVKSRMFRARVKLREYALKTILPGFLIPIEGCALEAKKLSAPTPPS